MGHPTEESPMRGAKSTVLMSVTAVLLLAGCGGGSAAGHSFAEPTIAIEPTAQARAEAMLMTSDDLPASWTSKPDTANHDRSASCAYGSGATETGRAYSDQFERTDASYDIHAQSQSIVFQTEDQARAVFEGVRDDAVPDCLSRAFTEAQRKDPDPDVEVHVTGADPLPVAKAGDESSGVRLTVDVTHAGHTTPVYLDLVFVRVGDSMSVLYLINPREPFDQTEQVSGSPSTADLAGVIADRMESARG
jgi:hypothetical protein